MRASFCGYKQVPLLVSLTARSADAKADVVVVVVVSSSSLSFKKCPIGAAVVHDTAAEILISRRSVVLGWEVAAACGLNHHHHD